MANFPSLWKGSTFGEAQNPLRAMARIQREMVRVLENFWGGDWTQSLPELPSASFQPLYNVEDKGSHYLLNMNIPGFSKDDIKVEVQDNQLHIFGERKEEHGEKKGRSFESSYGSVEQWLTLPQNTKPETVEAQIEHGVLRIAIPKTEASETKEIKIGEGKTGIFSKLLEKKEKAA
jgi:HSP20 family protein